MSLTTHSRFYFGHTITADNQYIDFDEGAGELGATLRVGAYSFTEFVDEIERAMNEVGLQEYTVTGNRTTRKITIAAGSAFDLLISTGAHAGASAFDLAGFTGADVTGATSYLGNAASGSEYTTQFILQSHIASDDYRGSAYGVVNKAASGRTEVVTFGDENFVQFNLKFVTDYSQPSGAPIRSSATGVADLRTFMQYLITKAPLEYMPDEDDADTFETVLLESTQDDSKGLKYKLRELYGQGLPGYFETGILTMRVLTA